MRVVRFRCHLIDLNNDWMIRHPKAKNPWWFYDKAPSHNQCYWNLKQLKEKYWYSKEDLDKVHY